MTDDDRPGQLDKKLRAFSSAERWIQRGIAYGAPALLLVFSLWAWLSWPESRQAPATQALSLQTLPAGALPAQASLAQINAALAAAPAQPWLDTARATTGFWVRVQRAATAHWTQLDWDSRHLDSLRCRDPLRPEVGHQGQRSGAMQGLRAERAGFVLDWPQGSEQLVCEAQFIGPARLQLRGRSSADDQLATQAFERHAGRLEGGLLTLAAFLSVTALINRNPSFMLFAVWMLLNLRMAAISGGWDGQWLGLQLPADWLHRSRLVTVALYYISTFAFFTSFFRRELAELARQPRGLKPIAWSCAPLLLLSFLLPHAWFLPLIWGCALLAVPVLLVWLGRILWQQRSPVAMWFSAAIAVTLAATLSEVLAAALGLKGLLTVVHSGTAALASSLLAALAMAARMKTEREQRQRAQARLEATYAGMPVGLFALSLDGRFRRGNPALARMLGFNGPLPEGQTWAQHFDEHDWQLLRRQLEQQPEAELLLHGRHGSEGRQFRLRATWLEGAIEGLLQDVTEQNQATERLRFLASNDPLTRVLNRRGLAQRFEAVQAQAPQQSLVVAYLDLDRFKLINDLYGHGAGDEVLRQVCARLSSLISEPMALGRVGGDEFVLLLPGLELAQGSLLARGLLATLVDKPYRVGERAFQVRGSIGVVELEPGANFGDALAAADRACREAKQSGGDGLVIYERDALRLAEMRAEMRLVASLASGAEVDGLFLEMQPIMQLRQPRASLNFEVLLRLHDAQGSRVPTPRLIAAAELSGRMALIDRWVLTETLRWLREHRERLANTQFVCVNLSGSSLNDERFIGEVFALLGQHADVAPLLCLEITESVALHDLTNTRRFIQQVRQYGARVALDDFGAGYTSFSYLKELPGDLLKIDGSFIAKINEHPANIAIVEAIVSLARNLGMRTIAEWAEDAAAVETLAEIGVDYVQGFAVARPQSPDKLLQQSSAADFADTEAVRQLIAQFEQHGVMTPMVVGATH